MIDKSTSISVDKGFYRRRRGVYEHMEVGSLGWLDIAIHDWLCGHAKAVMNSDKFPAGVWLGSVRIMWDKAGRDPNVPLRQLQRHVLKLEKLGYFRRFTVNKTTDAFVMHKLIVSDLTQTDYYVNAEETTDWTQPKYERVAQMTPTCRTDDVEMSSTCRTDDAQLCPMNETYETEETLETVDTLETTSEAREPDVPNPSPVKSKKKKVLSLSELPDSHFQTEPPDIMSWTAPLRTAWYTEKNLRVEKAKRVTYLTQTASTDGTQGQGSVLEDIRDWNEPRFNISGERLRNCIIYLLDYAKQDYFRKSEITPASMDRPKFINMLNDNTPLGWTPETQGKPKKLTAPSAWAKEDAI